MKRIILSLWVLCFGFELLAQEVERPVFSDNELYIGLKKEYAQTLLAEEGQLSRKAFLKAFSEVLQEEMLGDLTLPFYSAKGTDLQWVARLSITDSEEIEQIMIGLNNHDFSHYAERVPIFYLSHTPNDLGANSNNNQWHLYKIKAQEAWEYSRGSRQVKVAIVDDAMQITHPDLTNNVWVNPGEIANNGIDDDQNGYVDDVNGYDVGGNDNNPMPNYNNFSHGTHCAGIAGATTNNNTGIASIGYNITLIPVKCTTTGQTNTTSIPRGYQGITYAVAAGADIISCSWGSISGGNTGAQVIQLAQSKGAVVVAAMGNDYNEQRQYPASYSGVISVAATANNDSKATYSNYDTTTVISAPGNYLNSTLTNSTYGSQSGTSMATPLVAGLFGLMKSHMLGIEVDDLKNCLINSTDNIDALNPTYAGKLGSGRINAERSLQCVDAIKQSSPPKINLQDFGKSYCPGSFVNFEASSTLGYVDSVRWEFDGGTPNTSSSLNPTIHYSNQGTYSVKLWLYNANGSDSKIISNGVVISDQGTARMVASGFETGLGGSIWTVDNENPNFGWEDVFYLHGSDTNHAVKLKGHGSGANGLLSTLTSDELNFSDYGNAQLTFNFAYAPRNATAKDSLFIEISTNKGVSFERIYAANLSTDLVTSSLSNGAFTPVSDAQWCEDQGKCFAISLKRLNRAPSVILRVSHLGASNGNNFYLDDILVEGNCAVFNTEAAVAATETVQVDACGPVAVNFVDASLNFPSRFHWYFPGGIPAESENPNVTVNYNQVGEYDVIMVAENQYGKDSAIWTNRVRVHELPAVTVSASDTVFCAGASVSLTANGANAYTWSPLVAISSTSGKTITASPPSSTTYQVEGKDAFGCTNTASIRLEVLVAPQQPLIFKSGSRLYIAVQSGVNYQWYRDGILIEGATSFEHTALISGNYDVKVSSSTSGCFVWSRGAVSVIFASAQMIDDEGVQLYPNPANISFALEQKSEIGAYKIYASDGRMIHEGHALLNHLIVPTSNWSAGVYLIRWGDGDTQHTRKIVIQH